MMRFTMLYSFIVRRLLRPLRAHRCTSKLRLHSDSRASAAVEFALVLPFMVILLAGVTELGKALWHQHTLTKSVRDGARFLARNQDPTSAAAQTAVKNIVVRGVYDSSANSNLPLLVSYYSGPPTITISSFNNNGTPPFRGPAILKIVDVSVSVVAPTDAFPLLSLINGMEGISFAARHKERFIGE